MGLKNSVTTKFSDLGKIVLSEKKIKDRYTGSNFTVP